MDTLIPLAREKCSKTLSRFWQWHRHHANPFLPCAWSIATAPELTALCVLSWSLLSILSYLLRTITRNKGTPNISTRLLQESSWRPAYTAQIHWANDFTSRVREMAPDFIWLCREYNLKLKNYLFLEYSIESFWTQWNLSNWNCRE